MKAARHPLYGLPLAGKKLTDRVGLREAPAVVERAGREDFGVVQRTGQSLDDWDQEP